MAVADTEGTDRADLLLAEDVAAMVGMTANWVYAETRAGRIPHLKLGRYYRYRRASIAVWLRDLERGGAPNPGGAGERE